MEFHGLQLEPIIEDSADLDKDLDPKKKKRGIEGILTPPPPPSLDECSTPVNYNQSQFTELGSYRPVKRPRYISPTPDVSIPVVSSVKPLPKKKTMRPHQVKISSGFCSCSKSKCLKKYCDCFVMGIACGRKCRCSDCQNKTPSGRSASIPEFCKCKVNPDKVKNEYTGRCKGGYCTCKKYFPERGCVPGKCKCHEDRCENH